MMLALAATFHPRGETARLVRLYPRLQAAYGAIVISLPPQTGAEDLAAIQALPNALAYVNPLWAMGRYKALQLATQTGADFIHYADLDRLLRWVEIFPKEWLRTLERIPHSDYLLMERSELAWETHPAALVETERISSGVISQLLGMENLDISAGARGLSSRAARFIVRNGRQDRALGTDAEWLVLCNRAGYTIDRVQVNGLDWEIPDQHQAAAADAERQRSVAESYDADASKWLHRVRVAQEIAAAGMDAWKRSLQYTNGLRCVEVRRHSKRAIPEAHLTAEGVGLARRVGEHLAPFERVVTSQIPRAFETALAMGYAVNEQDGCLNLPLEGEGVVEWDDGIMAWQQAYHHSAAVKAYSDQQAALIREIVASLSAEGAALVISHGGIVETQVVGCLPNADFSAWGGAFSYCEGARLIFDGEQCVSAEVLRV